MVFEVKVLNIKGKFDFQALGTVIVLLDSHLKAA